MLGGLGVLIPRLRKFSGWGLIALLIAVYPANIYMALTPEAFPDVPLSSFIYALSFNLFFSTGLIWLQDQFIILPINSDKYLSKSS